MIHIDCSDALFEGFKRNGWRQNPGYAIRNNPRVFERGSERIAVVLPIRVNVRNGIQNELDKFFKTLEKIILKNGIRDIFIQGGGTFPMPEFFKDFCRINGINIHVITEENVFEYDNWNPFG